MCLQPAYLPVVSAEVREEMSSLHVESMCVYSVISLAENLPQNERFSYKKV